MTVAGVDIVGSHSASQFYDVISSLLKIKLTVYRNTCCGLYDVILHTLQFFCSHLYNLAALKKTNPVNRHGELRGWQPNHRKKR